MPYLHCRLLHAALLAPLALALAACGAPGAPAAGNTAAPPPTPAAQQPAVAPPSPTAAATATAQPSPTAAATVTAQPSSTAEAATPAPAAGQLPRPAYFIDAASGQVVRVETDGVTTRQITFEDLRVSWLAVAETSGTIVYATADEQGAGKLYALDGSGRRQLMAGTISRPALSPDGQTVAYRLDNAEPGLIIGQQESPAGVWASSTAGMRPTLIRADEPDDDQYDPDRPAWVYSPIGYSPDGTRLALSAFDSDGPGIPGGQVLILDRLGQGETATFTCCEEERWSADSAALTVAGGPPGPDLRYGLYRIDAASGEEQAVLTDAGIGGVPLVIAPQQLADGEIYAFVELVPPDELSWEYPYTPALTRVSRDGTTTPLRPADVVPFEVLWDAQAAGALVTTLGPEDLGDVGGRLAWLPVGGAPLLLDLRGYNPRWAAAAPLSAGDCGMYSTVSYEPPETRVVREEARDVQRRLAALGLDPGAADGLYGEQTQTAVRAFQQARGLPSSGDVDCATWQAMLTMAEGER